MRPSLAELIDQQVPAHFRHHDVSDDDVDRRFVLAHQVERLDPVMRRAHVVAGLRKHLGGERADAGIVLDEEHALVRRPRDGGDAGPWRRARVIEVLAPRHASALGGGKMNRERRSHSRRALGVNVAERLLHDAVHRRQTETRAAARGLRGEEGLEGARQSSRIHSRARCRARVRRT